MGIPYDKIRYENRVDKMIINMLDLIEMKLNIFNQDNTYVNNL